MADISEYISQAEYGRRCGLSRERIGKLVSSGKIKTVKVGNNRLIHRDTKIERRDRDGDRGGKQRPRGAETYSCQLTLSRTSYDILKAEARNCGVCRGVMMDFIIDESLGIA